MDAMTAKELYEKLGEIVKTSPDIPIYVQREGEFRGLEPGDFCHSDEDAELSDADSGEWVEFPNGVITIDSWS